MYCFNRILVINHEFAITTAMKRITNMFSIYNFAITNHIIICDAETRQSRLPVQTFTKSCYKLTFVWSVDDSNAKSSSPTMINLFVEPCANYILCTSCTNFIYCILGHKKIAYFYLNIAQEFLNLINPKKSEKATFY